MKKLAFLAIVLMASTSLFAAPIQVDFDGSPPSNQGPTQAGWISGITTVNPTDLGGGVSLSWGAPGQGRDRGTASPMDTIGLTSLLQDFIRYNEPSSAADHTVTITGLPDGDWNITVYCFDNNMPSTETYHPTINGTTLVIGPRVAGDVTTVSGTVQVHLASGAGNVVSIYDAVGDAANNLGLLMNGLVIDVVPEPATMLLVGTGLLGLTGFLRRRMMK